MLGKDGFLSYDPTLAATTLAILKDTGAGGGLISGNGTFYSAPTQLRLTTDVTDLVVIAGTIAGTLTVEVSNDTEQEDRLGTSTWVTYTDGTLPTIPAIAGAPINVPIQLKRVGWGRMRLKLVVTSGTGTVSSKRVIKGMG